MALAVPQQGFDRSFARTPLADGASLGVHESQSRMWENLVARSLPFWEHFYPRLLTRFPGVLDGVGLEAFHRGINRVSPSLIRVEADAATYNLHIMLRLDLEVRMLEGTLAVKDQPAAWNEGMREFLGVVPPDDARGVLQDVHWSGGSIGYFPTYALGNLVAAQLWERIRADLPGLDDWRSSRASRGRTCRGIASGMRRRRFAKDTTIFKQGDSARELFVLVSGKVAVSVESGNPEVPPVKIIEAPNWLGELGLLTGGPRFVTITALVESETWVLSRRSFAACVATHPVIYRNLIPSLFRRIQDTDRELVEQSGLALERARLLADLQQRNAELAALTEVTQAVSEPLDLHKSLETISTHAAQVTRSDAACIFLFDPDRNTFTLSGLVQHVP